MPVMTGIARCFLNSKPVHASAYEIPRDLATLAMPLSYVSAWPQRVPMGVRTRQMGSAWRQHGRRV